MKLANTRLSNRWFQMVLEPGERAPTQYLLNYKTDKSRRVYQVENNLVNRMVLGLDVAPDLPDSLFHGRSLLPHQVEDVKKIITVPNCCNFNRMGTGKTIESVAAMRELGVRNAVIVSPKSVIDHWIEKILQWYPETAGSGKRVIAYEKKCRLDKDTFVVLNYEKLMDTATITSLKSFAWDVLIVDEAHRIKNAKSQRSKNVADLPAIRRWPLTGSPILNRPTDLWNILHFADWQYSGSSYRAFCEYFCEVAHNGFADTFVGLTPDSAKIAILNALLQRVSVSGGQKMSEGKTIIPVKLTMKPKQRTLYRRVKTIALEELPENCTIANGMVLTVRLQQVTSCPAIFDDYENEVGVKFEWILETCLDHSETKFLIVSKFEQVINRLVKYLNSKGVKTVAYTGKISDADKYENKSQFLRNPTVQVLAATIGAIGTGTDGLQDVCHALVAIDKDWSPKINEQMEDRLDRHGQREHVLCYYLECAHSWDQHIGRVNLDKAADIKLALQEDY